MAEPSSDNPATQHHQHPGSPSEQGYYTGVKRRWLGVIAVLILAAFVVPFTALTNIDAWYGSFLFWTVLTAVVIAINALVSSAWRD
ncbi:MAG: hypothetical protein WC184_05340 [Acidimicrobiia bacterium]